MTLRSSRPSPASRVHRTGVALLEALVALAILAAALAVTAQAAAAAGRLDAEAAEAARRAETERLALDLLREELALAGYAPGPAAPAAPPPLEILPAERGDRILVRYVDDVWSDPPARVEARWEAGLDRERRPALYRGARGDARQPAVAGVTSLRVLDAGPPLRLELSFAWGSVRHLIVPQPSRSAGAP